MKETWTEQLVMISVKKGRIYLRTSDKSVVMNMTPQSAMVIASNLINAAHEAQK